MRLFKLLVTLLILGLIAIFFYQNLQTWTQPVSFKLNLYFYQTNTRPPGLDLYSVILLSTLFGFLVGIALLLKPYFRTRRLLKRERQEKKDAQEEFALRLARAESRGEPSSSAGHSNQGEDSEKQD